MQAFRPTIGALLVVLATYGQTGPVHDLGFTAGDDGYVISWQPPAATSPEQRYELTYEVQDRGAGPWRPVHEGPELRLTVLALRAGACTLRVRALYPDGAKGPWTEADCTVELEGAETPPAKEAESCHADDHTACVLEGRFAISVAWEDETQTHPGRVLPGRRNADPEFAFGASDRTALRVTVFDNCRRNRHYGVEYETRTARQFTISVTDTLAGQTKSFLAPAGADRAPRVRFSEVFATCEDGAAPAPEQ